MECHLVFHQTDETDTVKACLKTATKWQIKEAKAFLTERKINMQMHSKPYVYIRVPKRDQRPVQEIIQEYLKEAEEIRLHTRVDPQRIGSLKDTAMFIFRKSLAQNHIKLDKASPMEARWLHFAHRGGLMYAKPGIYKDVYKYDFTSFYPSICNSDCMFPIGKPTKHILTSVLDLNVLAVYRVKMLTTSPLLHLKKIDKHDIDYVYATNLDLQSAQSLGLKFQLEPASDWANCLAWEGIRGSCVFKGYVDQFFKMKQQGIKSGKAMLNTLTGGLMVQKERKFESGAMTGKDIDVSRFIIQSLTPDVLSYFTTSQQVFRHPDLARFGVFVTAHGRRKMVQTLKPHLESGALVRAQTDGFVLQGMAGLEDKDATKLGTLKLEYQGDMNVVHVNKCIEL